MTGFLPHLVPLDNALWRIPITRNQLRCCPTKTCSVSFYCSVLKPLKLTTESKKRVCVTSYAEYPFRNASQGTEQFLVEQNDFILSTWVTSIPLNNIIFRNWRDGSVLRAFIALEEDQSSVPSAHLVNLWLMNLWMLLLKIQSTLLVFAGTQMHVNICICRHTPKEK